MTSWMDMPAARMRTGADSSIAAGLIFFNGPASIQSPGRAGFTLIELILVLALLVIITSITLPRMSGFIRGRALDSESRQFLALIHDGQSRAVSEGMPMVLWVNSQAGQYGLAEENPGKTGDAKAEFLTLDSAIQVAVSMAGLAAPVRYQGQPAIRFLPDGTVGEGSPQKIQLSDQDGFGRLLVELPNQTGYELDALNQ